MDHIVKATVDTSNATAVNLAKEAIHSLYPVLSQELLNEQDVSTVELFFEVPCRRRLCDTITKKLDVTAQKTYFEDDVM